jgi:hypothetical protein
MTTCAPQYKEYGIQLPEHCPPDNTSTHATPRNTISAFFELQSNVIGRLQISALPPLQAFNTKLITTYFRTENNKYKPMQTKLLQLSTRLTPSFNFSFKSK